VRLGAGGKYHWHWDPLFSTAQHDLAAWERHLESCARKLALPTLLIRGGLSDVLSDTGAREFLAMCPQSEYVDVADAGHMVAGDRNDVFGTAVQAFLRRIVPIGRDDD
jgi:pimeloyl-ACP methyl ester carboxylesterase